MRYGIWDETPNTRKITKIRGGGGVALIYHTMSRLGFLFGQNRVRALNWIRQKLHKREIYFINEKLPMNIQEFLNRGFSITLSRFAGFFSVSVPIKFRRFQKIVNQSTEGKRNSCQIPQQLHLRQVNRYYFPFSFPRLEIIRSSNIVWEKTALNSEPVRSTNRLNNWLLIDSWITVCQWMFWSNQQHMLYPALLNRVAEQLTVGSSEFKYGVLFNELIGTNTIN